MNHSAIYLLKHLERVEQKNAAWRVYIMSRIGEVQHFIVRLRVFAARKPGRVADFVSAKADELQSRRKSSSRPPRQ